jgi:tetratricopeptide (TPR) repeat protein
MNFTMLSMVKSDGEVPIEKKLGYVKALKSSDKYAAEANKIAGEILQKEKRYAEAIAAYKAWGKEIEFNYRVAECQFLSGNLTAAIGELELLESSYKSERGKAAITMARYYDKSKKETERNATLIRILRNYKGTSAHSEAHRWAENLGLRFTGSNE